MGGLVVNYFQRITGTPSDPPELFGREWGWAQDDATGNVYLWNPVDAAWAGVSLPVFSYGQRATMFHHQALVTVGNALQHNHEPLANYAINSLQNAPANGDTFTHGCILKAGTYTFSVMGFTYLDGGKIDWYINNSLQVSGQDWYAGSGALTVKTASVTVAADGYQQIKGVVNGKNGSSGNYYIQLMKYWFAQSAD